MKQPMPKPELRAKRKWLCDENRKYPDHLQQIPKEQWGEAFFAMKQPPIRVFRSREYLVQVIELPNPLHIRLSICRTAIDDFGNWRDDISWDEMQRLKNEAGYEDCDAIEIFPAEKDKVNVANMRHLWIDLASTGCQFTWRKT